MLRESFFWPSVLPRTRGNRFTLDVGDTPLSPTGVRARGAITEQLALASAALMKTPRSSVVHAVRPHASRHRRRATPHPPSVPLAANANRATRPTCVGSGDPAVLCFHPSFPTLPSLALPLPALVPVGGRHRQTVFPSRGWNGRTWVVRPCVRCSRPGGALRRGGRLLPTSGSRC